MKLPYAEYMPLILHCSAFLNISENYCRVPLLFKLAQKSVLISYAACVLNPRIYAVYKAFLLFYRAQYADMSCR